MPRTKSGSKRREAIECIAEDVQQTFDTARRLLDEGFQVFAHVHARSAFPLAVLVAKRRLTANHASKGVMKFDVSAAVYDLRHRGSIDRDLAEDILDGHRIAVMDGRGEGDTSLMIDSALKLLEVSEGKAAKRHRRLTAKAKRRRFGIGRLATAASTLFAFVGR